MLAPSDTSRKNKPLQSFDYRGYLFKSLAVTYLTPGILPSAPSGPASLRSAVQNRIVQGRTGAAEHRDVREWPPGDFVTFHVQVGQQPESHKKIPGHKDRVLFY